MDGWSRITGEVPDFVFVIVEKDPPHIVTVGRLDDDSAAEGEALYADALAKYVECVSTGAWPGYVDDSTITTLSLPKGWNAA